MYYTNILSKIIFKSFGIIFYVYAIVIKVKTI